MGYMWHLLVRWWPDILLALIFAIIADLARIGSAIRLGFRQIGNALSAVSVKRMRKRIVSLEGQKRGLASFLSSDKSLYLVTLRLLILMLMAMCAGAVLLIAKQTEFAPWVKLVNEGFNFWAIFAFAMALGMGVSGMKIVGLDSRAKVEKVIAELDVEIGALKKKVDARVTGKGAGQ